MYTEQPALAGCECLAAPSVWRVLDIEEDPNRFTHYITLTRWTLPSVPSLVEELCCGASYVLGNTSSGASSLSITAASQLPNDLASSLANREESTLELIASMLWVTGERERYETVDAVLLQYARMPRRYVSRICERYDGIDRTNMIVNSGWKGTATDWGLGYQWAAYAALNSNGGLDPTPELYSARSMTSFGLAPIQPEHAEHAKAIFTQVAPGLVSPAQIGLLQHFDAENREMGLLEIANRLVEERYVDPPDPITMCSDLSGRS